MVFKHSIVPDEMDLTWFFESEPKSANRSEGVLCYKIQDIHGVFADITFDAMLGSINFSIYFKGRELCKFSSEAVSKITLVDNKSVRTIISAVTSGTVTGEVWIQTYPTLHVKSYLLENND